jgi:hypothetical protein
VGAVAFFHKNQKRGVFVVGHVVFHLSSGISSDAERLSMRLI